MKLLGYKRVKGSKDGKEWDFVQLHLEQDFVESDANSGGSQLYLSYTPGKGNSIPSVDTKVFLAALKQGVKVGSDINILRSIDGKWYIDIL